MAKSKLNFDEHLHPRMYHLPEDALGMFEVQSHEDICEALASLLDNYTGLRTSYDAACKAAEIFQDKMEAARKEVKIKATELATLTETLEEREEELSKLTGVSLITCKCQVILPHDCKLKQA